MLDEQKLALFNLAAAFAAKNDVRHYLNAVHVQGDALYACNGHRCIRIIPKTNDTLNPVFGVDNTTYTAESVRNCVKVKRLDLLEEMACTPPQFDRLCKIPEIQKTGVASFNPQLLASTLAALAKYSKKPVEFTIFDSQEGARLSLQDDIAIIEVIVMPLWKTKGGE